MRTWIKDPLAILADGAERGIVVEGGRIAKRVGAGDAGALDAIFDASRHVVLPGLINTHHHFYQTLTRARPASHRQAAVSLARRALSDLGEAEAGAVELASRLALAELMLSGCTTAADHHYVYPEGLENGVDIEVEEARALGMRMTVSRGSMNLSEKDGGLPPDSVVQDEDTILADSERVVELFHDPKPGAQVSRRARALFAVFDLEAPHARDRATCRALRLPCIPTSPKPRMRSVSASGSMAGRSIIWRRCGWLTGAPGSRMAFISTPMRFRGSPEPASPSGIALQQQDAGVRICPVCELEAAGVAVGLGVDGSASNDSSNMMEAVRHALLIGAAALRRRQGQPSRRPALGDQRLGACLGRSDIGEIAEGYRPISRCSGSTSRASRARTIHSRRSYCAARIGPTA